MKENNNTRHLTEIEQLNAYIDNLIRYQEEVVREINEEIEKAKVKIKKIEGANRC